MKKQTNSTATLPYNPEAKFAHYSDGTELIPAEVSSESENDKQLVSGYTIDDEGIINNYAREPKMSEAIYPNRQQQFRYVLWGIGAIGLISVILSIAFAVS